MTRLLLVIALAVLCGTAQPVTVFLVRHAEKAPAPVEDPPLTPAGRTRAKVLASMLRDAKIAAVFSTQFKRTVETAKPTADRFKLAITQVSAADPADLRKQILALKGKAVLVVGHTNTLPPLIEALGGPADVAISETEYDRLLILHVTSAKTAGLTPLRYGAE
jgi:phosphohistidine phosphatase SixA